MEKFISKLLLSLSISAFLFSCKNEKPIEFDKIDYSKTYRSEYATDTVGGYCNVDIQLLYPSAFDKQEVLDKVQQQILTYAFDSSYAMLSPQQAVDTFAYETFENFKAFISKHINSQETKANPLILHNEKWEMSTMVVYNDKQILSYELDRSTFAGGAHGMDITQYLTFDLKTGDLISERDIFEDGYEARLSTLMRQQIMKDNGFESEEQMLNNGFFMAENINPNENFCVSDSGITYIFNPYEIGAYYLGQTEVTIPYKSIRSVLKTESPISDLIK